MAKYHCWTTFLTSCGEVMGERGARGWECTDGGGGEGVSEPKLFLLFAIYPPPLSPLQGGLGWKGGFEANFYALDIPPPAPPLLHPASCRSFSGPGSSPSPPRVVTDGPSNFREKSNENVSLANRVQDICAEFVRPPQRTFVDRKL